MEQPAFFVADDDRYVATTSAQGGWATDTANGGAVLALLGHCLDEVPTLVPMSIARYTADLVRPVPLGRPLRVESSVLREGKKIQLVETLLFEEEVLHARASALRLREQDVRGAPGEPTSTTHATPADRLVSHADLERLEPREPGHAGFLAVADMRPAPAVDGGAPGLWVRLAGAVVAGQPVRPTARLTFCFDYANLIGLPTEAHGMIMINPDVSAHVLRPPTDDWVAITGDTRFEPSLGRGVSTASMSDTSGPFAHVSISQLLQI